MTELFLKIYDCLSRHRLAVMLGTLALTLAFVALSLRLNLEEDISKFLPGDARSERYAEVYNSIGRKNNIILIFDGDDEYGIEEAIDAFGENFDRTDSLGLVPERQIRVPQDAALELMDEVMANVPLYMEDGDYDRIDSLITVDGYVRERLAADRKALLFPASDYVTSNLSADPLQLFSPVLSRLASTASSEGYQVRDEYLFTTDGKGLAFLTSPYGMSESGKNAQVSRMVDRAMTLTMEQCPGVRISAVGAPLIAVTNATQIKRDSFLCIGIAILLIFSLLWLSFRRLSDIAWIGAATLFGWLFALAGVSLLRDSMSVIVIGVASVIVGIAVNYPLHFMDGLKSGTSPRENLAEMVSPLLTGNITTIAAFLCLLFLDAQAMRDLGLFGSLMLCGTILFVLLLLPVFSRARHDAPSTFELGNLLPSGLSSSSSLFLALMAVTAVLYFFGRGSSFDADMGHINYMTDSQRSGMAMLSDGQGQALYAIATGSDRESALRANDGMIGKLQSVDGLTLKGPGDFLPSESRQQDRIGKWNSFWRDSGKGSALLEALLAEAPSQGFSERAFEDFARLLTQEPQISSLSANEEAFFGGYLIKEDGKYLVVNRILLSEPSRRQDVVSLVESGGDDTLAFSAEDISGNLVKILSESFDYIGWACSLVVFLFLLLSFGSLELCLLSFLPLAVSWLWILGLMGIAGLSFNIVNIILATFIFGQGDDYTIFITEGLMYEYTYGRKRLQTYKNSVLNSALIMFAGIGVLVFAKHPAMRSLGLVTVIGMFTVVIMAYCLPPVIFSFLTKHRGRLRRVPLTIASILRSVYCLSVFVAVTYLYLYPYTFICFNFGKMNSRRMERFRSTLQKVARLFVYGLPGVSVRVRGSLDLSKPAVVLCNHQSNLDIMLLLMLSPKLVLCTNEEVWNTKVYGYLIRKAGFIPIYEGYDKCMPEIRERVAEGLSVAVYPEGTRSPDCRIDRFHKGAFYIASSLGLDVIPVYLHGIGHVLPKGEYLTRRGSVHVEVGERVPSMPDYRAATKYFHRLYLTHYEELRARYESPAYWKPLLLSLYLYKTAEVQSEVRSALSGIRSMEDFGRASLSGGFGAVGVLYALTHPAESVRLSLAGEDYAVASQLSGLPSNLQITQYE